MILTIPYLSALRERAEQGYKNRFQPSVVLTLLDEIERARKRIAELEAAGR